MQVFGQPSWLSSRRMARPAVTQPQLARNTRGKARQHKAHIAARRRGGGWRERANMPVTDLVVIFIVAVVVLATVVIFRINPHYFKFGTKMLGMSFDFEVEGSPRQDHRAPPPRPSDASSHIPETTPKSALQLPASSEQTALPPPLAHRQPNPPVRALSARTRLDRVRQHCLSPRSRPASPSCCQPPEPPETNCAGPDCLLPAWATSPPLQRPRTAPTPCP
jgi:hypothetical protein